MFQKNRKDQLQGGYRYPCWRIDPVTDLVLERVIRCRDEENNNIRLEGDNTDPRTKEELAVLRRKK